MRCAAGASSSSVERDESKSLNSTSTLFTHTKIPAYNSRLDRPQPQRSITHRTIGVFVFVVARTEIERVETVITRKRPLEVRRSGGTRHPERARARLGASHDRTARDGGSSLRRRAKAGKTNERTNVRASGRVSHAAVLSRFTRRLNKIIRTHRRVAFDASTRRCVARRNDFGRMRIGGEISRRREIRFPLGRLDPPARDANARSSHRVART